ncbi:hypothetical protein CPB83DRAFT_893380 [Crepidotus variabilis]|uniref:Uncharacterized protein n=1 Tax=Crepidotus variabilis TaxID=179855 RepID=A0A9P6EI97_9AGAR|nr:hypothetical protein CPB83DRAFT_893380 [Crepidotus variabilis]
MPSAPSSPIQPSSESAHAELARTKRKLASVEAKLAQATGKKRKHVSNINLGRGLSRLVSLFDSLSALVDEADRRFAVQRGDIEEEEEVDEIVSRERDRCFASYILLLRTVPRVKDLIEDSEQEDELTDLLDKLQHGANEARRDDLRRILGELPQWLNEDFTPERAFSLKNRRDRGLQNAVTGRLLCPISYNWDDTAVRTSIRNGTISIADDFYLACFYPRATGNVADVEARFLRSKLLVKAYCAIFTSPSSADAFEEESEEGPARKRRRVDAQKKITKSTVADLIGMEGKVTPRTIAHAAVMLAFNLTNCEHWRPSYNGFSYHSLYNFIIDFFEDVHDPITRRKVDQLLVWWNLQVFPDHVATVSDSQKSNDKLKRQRAQRAAASNVAANPSS